MRNTHLMCGWFLVVVALSVFAATASAQDTSTQEERMQWVEVTHKLESAPLDDSVNKQGEAAFKRLSDVHDVHVLLCPALLSEFNGMKYVYAHTITRQYMLASGAFQIENPDKAARHEGHGSRRRGERAEDLPSHPETKVGGESQAARRSAEEAEPREAQRRSEAVPLTLE
jgi:hypothetical protein